VALARVEGDAVAASWRVCPACARALGADIPPAAPPDAEDRARVFAAIRARDPELARRLEASARNDEPPRAT
jgi:hypothetical protein